MAKQAGGEQKSFKPSPQLEGLGVTLRTLREERGMSQEALASTLDFHRNYIGRVERAELNISMERLFLILDALGLRLSDLAAHYEQSDT